MSFRKKTLEVFILKRMRNFELHITSVVLSSNSLSRRATTSVKEGLSSGLCIQLWHIISYLKKETKRSVNIQYLNRNKQTNNEMYRCRTYGQLPALIRLVFTSA